MYCRCYKSLPVAQCQERWVKSRSGLLVSKPGAHVAWLHCLQNAKQVGTDSPGVRKGVQRCALRCIIACAHEPHLQKAFVQAEGAPRLKVRVLQPLSMPVRLRAQILKVQSCSCRLTLTP